MLGKTHFEIAVEKAKRDLADAALALPLGESLRHAEIKGKHAGLDQALQLYRNSIRDDLDEAA